MAKKKYKWYKDTSKQNKNKDKERKQGRPHKRSLLFEAIKVGKEQDKREQALRQALENKPIKTILRKHKENI
jgi:hypothetical protein